MTERETRIERLKELRKQGIEAYPVEARRSHTVEQALVEFDKLSAAEKLLTLCGRLKSKRLHGKAGFGDLEDGSGKIQIFFSHDDVGDRLYKLFKDLIDVGDILEVRGILFTTKVGQKTLRAQSFTLLTKSLLPLPEKWHGLSDVEIRFRQRYLDLISNPEVRAIFQKRAAIVKAIREFFYEKQYMEVETPILQPIAGGASAEPFKTHHNALDADLYLRIAPELYLKRLLVGGFEKVFEISRCFRNEGIDRWHNPEFTQVEFYEAYKSYEDYMNFVEELLEYVLYKVQKDLIVTYENKAIDFARPYPRLSFRDALLQYAKIDISAKGGSAAGGDTLNRDELAAAAKKLDLQVMKEWGKGEIYDEIYKKVALKNIIQPTFIIDHPIELSPLAKQKPGHPGYVERFQLVVDGTEVANAFSELNDPLDQRERFEEQEKLRKGGLKEAQRIDHDFLEALEHGMPPAAGCGIGIDRLSIILTGAHSLKEVILFPTLKQK